jgi:hypothetical protein
VQQSFIHTAKSQEEAEKAQLDECFVKLINYCQHFYAHFLMRELFKVSDLDTAIWLMEEIFSTFIPLLLSIFFLFSIVKNECTTNCCCCF